MKRRASDFVRYLGQLARLFATGYSQIGKARQWAAAAAIFGPMLGLGFLIRFLIDQNVTMTLSVAEIVVGVLALGWLVVAVGWSAYKFRPSPTLAMKSVVSDGHRQMNMLHYRIQLVNESRGRIENCGVTLESCRPGIEGVPLRLPPGTVALNEGESCLFDLCLFPAVAGIGFIKWFGDRAKPTPAGDGVEVALLATGSGVPPVRLQFSIRLGDQT